MKILLIRPSQIRWNNEEKRCGTPTGLLSIASVLRNEHDVYFIDSVAEGYETEEEIKLNIFRFGLSNNNLEKRIEKINPDIVGITNGFTSYWEPTLETAKLVKKVNPNIVTILGGQHPTWAVKEILERNNEIDFIILGEGEKQTKELIQKLEEKSDFQNINGVTYKKNNQVIINPKLNYNTNLDNLPDPAWDLLDIKNYNYKMSHYGMPRNKNFIDVLFSLGCWVNCDFCNTPKHHGKKIRHFSLERILEQTKAIKNLGWKEIVIEDDNYTKLPKKIQYGIAKNFGKVNIDWVNDGGIYFPDMTEELAQIMAENGCYRVFLPVESPSMKTIHKYSEHKYKTLDSEKIQKKKVKEVATYLNKAGIEFYPGIMIGFPGEGKKELEKAINYAKFLKDLGAFAVTFHWTHPYPGTRLYEQFYHLVPKERKWQNNSEYYGLIKPVFPIKGISFDYAEKLIDEAFLEINGTNSRNTSYKLKK